MTGYWLTLGILAVALGTLIYHGFRAVKAMRTPDGLDVAGHHLIIGWVAVGIAWVCVIVIGRLS